MIKKYNKLSKIRTFSSLKNPTFRLYYIGMVGQWSSMNMQIVARSLLIYRISGSGAILGLASLANAIPTIAFSLFGGALADRLQKKDILLFSMIGSMLVSLAVAFALTMGYLSTDVPGSWWILVVTAAIQGTIMGLMMPSRQAIIAEIVDREQVMNAVSLNTMGMNAFRILAPAATGFLIEGFDFASVYYISGAMYGMASICMFLMPKTTQKFSEGDNALTDIVDGVRYIRREKTMLLVLVATLFVMICGIPFLQLMPMITEDILEVGASGMGILLSVSGMGAITGSLILASLPSRKRGTIMLVSGVLMGLALVVFAFSSWWLVSVLVVIFIGLGQTGHRTTGNALAQNYTAPEYRGRVMSFMMMGLGFSSLGTFVAGVLAESIGIQWAIGGLAILLVIVSVALLTFTSRLRKLE
ncbi:MAG: MFS transporter [Dehalococcoidales bacterium]|nr:MFS transporter [Dehalococcoidales bacterium]